MSGLSHKNHGELNNIIESIVISEQNPLDPRKSISSRLRSVGADVLKNTIKPIVRKSLNVPQGTSVARHLTKNATGFATKQGLDLAKIAAKTVVKPLIATKRAAQSPIVQWPVGLSLGGGLLYKAYKDQIEPRLQRKFEEVDHQDIEVLSEELIVEHSNAISSDFVTYLVANGYAKDGKAAFGIFENMSDQWFINIFCDLIELSESKEGQING